MSAVKEKQHFLVSLPSLSNQGRDSSVCSWTHRQQDPPVLVTYSDCSGAWMGLISNSFRLCCCIALQINATVKGATCKNAVKKFKNSIHLSTECDDITDICVTDFHYTIIMAKIIHDNSTDIYLGRDSRSCLVISPIMILCHHGGSWGST